MEFNEILGDVCEEKTCLKIRENVGFSLFSLAETVNRMVQTILVRGLFRVCIWELSLSLLLE